MNSTERASPHARAALIVCGGASLRMGRSKAWLDLEGEPMLARVVRRVAPSVDQVVVVSAPGQELPPLPDRVTLLRDRWPGAGPLGGLATGLQWLEGRVALVYATGTDMPLLAPGWVEMLAHRIGTADCVVPFIQERAHPLAAIYRPRPTFAAADSLIQRGQLRLLGLLERLNVQRIEPDALRAVDPELGSVCNLNTMADYESLQKRLQATGESAGDSGPGDSGTA